MSAPNYIRPGSRLQEFPAGTTNWLIENVKLLLAERGGRSSNGLSAFHQVLMKNEHTEPINSPFGVLALDGPINNPADFEFEPYNGIKLRGIAPEAEEDRFAVLQCSIDQGEVTPAIISGPTWARVNVIDEADTVCGPIADDTSKLKSGIGNTPIIWKEDGTGEKWAMVLLGGTGAVQAELIGVCAVVKGTVPASSNVNTTGPMYTGNETNLLGVQVFTPGVLPLAFDFSTYLFNAGAVICNPDGTAAVRTLSDGTKEPVVAEVVNPSYTDFHGGDGVITTGSLVEIDGETAKFILSWPDLRAMPNHEAGNPPTGDDDASQQVIRHKGGDDNYEASVTEDCG